MASSFFPDFWWRMSPLDYDRSFMALKALAAKDLEPGTKDVSALTFHSFQFCSFVLSVWRIFGLPFHGCWFAASLSQSFISVSCFLQQVSHYERVFPEAHDAIKALYEIIGESSATKAVEGYAPYRPGDITVPTTSTPRTNKLARRHASFFKDDSDDDEEEISILRGDLKKIFAKLTTADRLER